MAAEEEAGHVMYRRGGLGLIPIFQYPASDAVRGDCCEVSVSGMERGEYADEEEQLGSHELVTSWSEHFAFTQ